MYARLLTKSLLLAVMVASCLSDSAELAFMKNMQQKFKNYHGSSAGANKAMLPLGTSLHPINSEGSNLTMTVGSKIDLEFNFDTALVDGSLPSAMLWLFTDATGSDVDSGEKDVEFVVTVRCQEKQYGTKHHIALKWTTGAPCVTLDVTLPIKRVIKFLSQSQEKHATLTVEVAGISDHTPEVTKDGEEVCRTLDFQTLDGSGSFLYLQLVDLNDEDVNSRNRRSAPPPQQSHCCTRTELVIDFHLLPFDNIIYPITADIGLCVKTDCDGAEYETSLHTDLTRLAVEHALESNSSTYSPEIVRRVQEDLHCVPADFEPIVVIFASDPEYGRYDLIQLIDGSVKTCNYR